MATSGFSWQLDAYSSTWGAVLDNWVTTAGRSFHTPLSLSTSLSPKSMQCTMLHWKAWTMLNPAPCCYANFWVATRTIHIIIYRDEPRSTDSPKRAGLIAPSIRNTCTSVIGSTILPTTTATAILNSDWCYCWWVVGGLRGGFGGTGCLRRWAVRGFWGTGCLRWWVVGVTVNKVPRWPGPYY